MEYFAGYGFNKSHSAAYALIAHQTAFLKANYIHEFMACLISLESGDSEHMAFYVQEAKDMGLEILQPDINKSDINFSVENKKIRLGLHGIKNVGLAALENILSEREKKSEFTSLLNFCKRVDLRTCNKRVVENLIAAGAFDSLPGNRAQKTEELAKIMDLAAEHKKSLLTGQMGLFESVQKKENSPDEYTFAVLDEWTDKIKLEKEKEMMGIYISAQPMDFYKNQIKWLQPITFTAAQQLAGQTVLCCGTTKGNKVVTTKKGDKMAFMFLEDQKGKAEVIIFPKLYSKVASLLNEYSVFVVSGQIDESSNSCKIKANDLLPIELYFDSPNQIPGIKIHVQNTINIAILEKLKLKINKNSNSRLEIILEENSKKSRLVCKQKIEISSELLNELEQHNLEPKIISVSS